MAYTGIFATLAQVQMKVGPRASSVSNTETYINSYMAQAESFINAATLTNWSDKYSTINTDLREILQEAASCIAAIYVIQYDISGYFPQEAALMINILTDRYVQAIKILQDSKTKNFLGAI